jgi:hypothetical protein
MGYLKIKIYVGENRKEVVRGSNLKILYKHIKRLFDEGYTNIIVSGGTFGSWR